ncbi:YiiX/YebB-like N1pC/P60 family cysteine hydrolase, partial [Verrucomicrobiota bacterium]
HTFYLLDYLAQPELHADCFYLAYAAYVTQYDATLTLKKALAANPSMATFLDEGDASRGIPAGFWSYMERWLTEPDTLLRLNAGAAYLALVKKDISFGRQKVAALESEVAALYKKLGKSPDLFLKSPLELFEKGAFQLWFPVQKSVAVQMSLMRTAARDYLITPEAVRRLIPRLEPGDILVERRNWHMTNVGIPGFWPHVALYVGTPEEVDACFDGLPMLNGMKASEWLRRSHPAAVSSWAGSTEFGRCRVIEALRDGIIFQPFEKSVNCDYLGVLRPTVGKASKLQALSQAFDFYGRAYDYNFDFATDNELVCSELVYKAYQSAEGMTLKPQMVQGRELLPPNILVQQALDATSGCAEPVLFIDALEKENRSFENSADKLAESWRRPKWDIMQN